MKGSKDVGGEEEEVDIEEEDKEKQQTGTVETFKLPQDCNQDKGQGKIYVVSGGQIPAYERITGKTTALQCCGGEHGMFLSHGNGWLFLQSGNLGAGELWFITPTTNKGFFSIRCCGSEKGLGLEHGEGQLQLMCNYGDPSEMWLVEKHHSPSPSLATTVIRGSISVTAAFGCSYKTAVWAQVSCGSLLSAVFQINSTVS